MMNIKNANEGDLKRNRAESENNTERCAQGQASFGKFTPLYQVFPLPQLFSRAVKKNPQS